MILITKGVGFKNYSNYVAPTGSNTSVGIIQGCSITCDIAQEGRSITKFCVHTVSKFILRVAEQGSAREKKPQNIYNF